MNKIDRVVMIVLDSCGCGAAPDAADDWIAERITGTDVCVTADIPRKTLLIEASWNSFDGFVEDTEAVVEMDWIIALIKGVRSVRTAGTPATTRKT